MHHFISYVHHYISKCFNFMHWSLISCKWLPESQLIKRRNSNLPMEFFFKHNISVHSKSTMWISFSRPNLDCQCKKCFIFNQNFVYGAQYLLNIKFSATNTIGITEWLAAQPRWFHCKKYPNTCCIRLHVFPKEIKSLSH